MSRDDAREYYLALKRIAKYESPEWLRRNSERRYDLSYEEALEMAYDNIRAEAQSAIRGKRAPRAIEKADGFDEMRKIGGGE